MPDLTEISSWLFWALVALICYIFKAFRDEIREDREQRNKMFLKVDEKIDKLEAILTSMAGNMHDRITKTENSINSLWGEHRILKDTHCAAYHRAKDDDGRHP